MSEETHESTPETTETERKAGVVLKPTPLHRESDQAVRPGFRSPSNKGSKAMKKGKKK